jgi:hypothetical protein
MSDDLLFKLSETRNILNFFISMEKRKQTALKRRRDLVPGSSRAKVTTANANWKRIAEQMTEESTYLKVLLLQLAEKL